MMHNAYVSLETKPSPRSGLEANVDTKYMHSKIDNYYVGILNVYN